MDVKIIKSSEEMDVVDLKVFTSICLERPKKTTKILTQSSCVIQPTFPPNPSYF
jgi:hypothetical protein